MRNHLPQFIVHPSHGFCSFDQADRASGLDFRRQTIAIVTGKSRQLDRVTRPSSSLRRRCPTAIHYE